MSSIKVIRGDTKFISLNFTSENLTFTFTLASSSYTAEAGDIYSQDSDMYVLNNDTNGTTSLTCQSDTTDAAAPRLTGTLGLNRVSGSGTSTLIYTAYTSTNEVDLTGSTIFFTVKENLEDADADAIISKSWTSHLNAQSGKTYYELSSSDTDIAPGAYFYDIQIKSPNGRISSIKSGSFVVSQDVTLRTT